MMRITTVLLCAFALAACSSADGGGGSGPHTSGADAASAPVCGDGICAATEASSCAADCGQASGPVCGNGICEVSKGETTASCAGDCPGGGSGSGSGSGSGACADPNYVLACIACLIDPTQCTGVDPLQCAACLAGP